MNAQVEIFIIAAIVVLAVTFLIGRTVKTLRGKGSCCSGGKDCPVCKRRGLKQAEPGKP